MNFVKTLKENDIIEISFFMGWSDDEQPDTKKYYVKDALKIATEANVGWPDDRYCKFHIGDHEVFIITDDDGAEVGFVVSHLADTLSEDGVYVAPEDREEDKRGRLDVPRLSCGCGIALDPSAHEEVHFSRCCRHRKFYCPLNEEEFLHNERVDMEYYEACRLRAAGVNALELRVDLITLNKEALAHKYAEENYVEPEIFVLDDGSVVYRFTQIVLDGPYCPVDDRDIPF